MASELPQVNSCFFPVAIKPSGDEKRPLSVRVDLQYPGLVQQLLAQEKCPDALAVVVRTTWALLLRTYTGLDRVCFGFDAIGGGIAESNTDKGTDPHVCMLDIGEDMSIQGLLESSKDCTANMFSASEANDTACNTAVLLRFGAHAGSAQNSSKAMVMPHWVL